MGLIDHRFEDNFITTNVDKVLAWARQSSLWPMGFGLACLKWTAGARSSPGGGAAPGRMDD